MGRVLFKECEADERSGFVETLVKQHGQQYEEAQEEEEGYVTPSQLYAVIEKQQFRCALTGIKLQPRISNIDHMQPLSRGGVDKVSNIQVLHKTVNRMKHTMTQQEFIDMCCKVADWARSGGQTHPQAVAPSGGETP